MKITQFKKLLTQHGADLTRWEGVEEKDVKAFLDSSEQAKELLAQEAALDNALASYKIDEPDPAMLENVMARIEGEQDKGASAHRLEPQKKMDMPLVRPPFMWSGAVTIAAAIILFVSIWSPSPDVTVQSRKAQAPAVVASDDDYSEELDVMLATVTEEEIERQEIILLWELADASDAINEAAEIDRFLDDLFANEGDNENALQDDPALQEEMDLWDLFLSAEADTREL